MIDQVRRVGYLSAGTDSVRFEDAGLTSASLIGPLIHKDRRALRYCLAIAMVLVVGGLRLALTPIMETQALLLPFILAVLGAALFGGVGPAILASVLAPVLVTLVFTGPNELAWSSHVALFLLIAGCVTVLMQWLQRSAWAQQGAFVEMRQSQRDAIRSEAQMRRMADAMPILVSYIDANERYRFSNSAYANWFGTKTEELYGRHMLDVWGNAAYAVLRPHIQAALAGGSVNCEERLPFGSELRDVRVHLTPDIGHDKVRGLYALIEDIGEPGAQTRRCAMSYSQYQPRCVPDVPEFSIGMSTPMCLRGLKKTWTCTDSGVKLRPAIAKPG